MDVENRIITTYLSLRLLVTSGFLNSYRDQDASTRSSPVQALTDS